MAYDNWKLDYPEQYDNAGDDISEHDDACTCPPCMREYRQAQAEMRREDP